MIIINLILLIIIGYALFYYTSTFSTIPVKISKYFLKKRTIKEIINNIEKDEVEIYAKGYVSYSSSVFVAEDIKKYIKRKKLPYEVSTYFNCGEQVIKITLIKDKGEI